MLYEFCCTDEVCDLRKSVVGCSEKAKIEVFKVVVNPEILRNRECHNF